MSQIHRQKQSIRATYPERDREREMGEPSYSTSGASANVSSSSTAPDTAPSPASPCPRPPPRWPDAGPPMCAACRHRARSREREVPQRLSRGCRAWKETAAAAQEKKSVGGRAAAATGSRSKITEKIANK